MRVLSAEQGYCPLSSKYSNFSSTRKLLFQGCGGFRLWIAAPGPTATRARGVPRPQITPSLQPPCSLGQTQALQRSCPQGTPLPELKVGQRRYFSC